MKINIQQKLFSDKDKERISNELLNGIGAQPTPQPDVKNLTKKEKKRIYDIAYRAQNKEKLKVNKSKYYFDNKEIIQQKSKYRYTKNVERLTEINKIWAKNNPEKVRISKAKWFAKNSDYLKKYYQENSERLLLITKEKRLQNIDAYRLLERNRSKRAVKNLENIYVKQLLRIQGVPITVNTIRSKTLDVLISRSIKSKFKDLDTNRLRQLSNQILKGENNVNQL